MYKQKTTKSKKIHLKEEEEKNEFSCIFMVSFLLKKTSGWYPDENNYKQITGYPNFEEWDNYCFLK